MPVSDNTAVCAGSRILVTGATGFIGAHCVAELAKNGYYVRATARSMAKLETLRAAVGQEHRSKIDLVVIKDVRDFDELAAAVTSCDAVLHLASPFTYDVKNNVTDLLEPAVDGTVNIMRACLNEAGIKRIVITSSFAAIYDASKGLQPGFVYTEKEFSPLTWEDGAATDDPSVAYRASKIVAERAAWNFMEINKPSFDVTVVCPTMVFGPLFTTALLGSIDDLNLSNKIIWKVATSEEIPPTKSPLWVDVRDLASAQVQALSAPKASNSRYLVSAGTYDNQEIADCIRELVPDEAFRSAVPEGVPGARISDTHFTTDSSKAQNELGATFRPLAESVVDLCNQILALGCS